MLNSRNDVRGRPTPSWFLVRAPIALFTVSLATIAVTAEPPRENRPLVLQHDGYVGSESCKDCHAREYATWRASYHRKMAQVATPASVIGSFDNVELTHLDSLFQLQRRGEEFWVTMDDPAWSGPARERPRVSKQIVQTTGSHHLQAYWYPSGESRKLNLFPMCYHRAEQRWMPLDSVFIEPPGRRQNTSGRWNMTCSRCHATGVKPGITSLTTMDTRVAELGISCEACHGPAQEHVEQGVDIVQPGRLSAQLSAQVCGQCHGVSNLRGSEQLQYWAIHGYTFRPGQSLADSRLVVQPTGDELGPELQKIAARDPQFFPSHFWSDGTVRVSGREYNGLLRTLCHTHGREDKPVMSCLSCHKMHQDKNDPRPAEEWADDQLKPLMHTSEACVQCHAGYRDDQTLAAHTHHKAGSSGSHCYNCHMPYTTYGLQKAIRSHTIESPSVQTSLQTGRPNACNQCHLDRTLDWAAEHLRDWYGIEKPALSEDERNIAASVLWALKGDAGQRALMAWSFGWSDAKQTSGSDWMTPYLSYLMADPYAAVRFIAHRSLRRQADFATAAYDFLAPPEERTKAAGEIYREWSRAHAGPPRRLASEQVLIPAPGKINRDVVSRLLRERDNRPVSLRE